MDAVLALDAGHTHLTVPGAATPLRVEAYTTAAGTADA